MRYFLYIIALIVAVAVYVSNSGIIKTLGMSSTNSIPHNSAFASNTPRNSIPAGNNTAYFKQMRFEISNGHTLNYLWANPSGSHKKDTKFPLILILHGAGGWAHAAFYLPGKIHDNFPAFAFIPMLPKNTQWSNHSTFQNGDALPEIIDAIKKLQTKYPIDPKRIYVIGCSMGGIGAFAAARHYPDVFAAAIPIAGSWDPSDADALTQIPILAMHGTLDDVIPRDNARTTISEIRRLNGNGRYIEFPNIKHQCDHQQFYSKKIWSWLFLQSK